MIVVISMIHPVYLKIYGGYNNVPVLMNRLPE